MTSARAADVAGRVALVTGAGSGIGRAVALDLARLGMVVVLVGRRAAPLEATSDAVRGAGGTTVVEVADVSRPPDAARVVDHVRQRFGAVDLLVNNAGVNVHDRELDRIGVEDWNRMLDVNASGAFLLVRQVLPLMRPRGSGTIVNVSSMAAITASLISGPGYAASKAALNSLTSSINLAERRHGIRACAICPGEVATPILDDRPIPPPMAVRPAMLQPEDVASAVAFVATLPQRATVELMTIVPTRQRDSGAELR